MSGINNVSGTYQAFYTSSLSTNARNVSGGQNDGQTNQAAFSMDQVGISEEGKLALENARAENRSEKERGHGPLGDLVASGVITSEQRDAIKLAIDEAHKNKPPRPEGDVAEKPKGDPARDEALQKLVLDGTITEDQMNTIAATIDAARAEKRTNQST